MKYIWGVAQFGQSARFGTEESGVRIPPPRPFINIEGGGTVASEWIGRGTSLPQEYRGRTGFDVDERKYNCNPRLIRSL